MVDSVGYRLSSKKQNARPISQKYLNRISKLSKKSQKKSLKFMNANSRPNFSYTWTK